jgi:putative addiction module component (TIGR02574 family)
MTSLRLQQLLNAALQLSEDERIVLAGKLLESLTSTPVDSAWTTEWGEEVSRRWQELESGAVLPVPWSEVERQLQGMLGEYSRD